MRSARSVVVALTLLSWGAATGVAQAPAPTLPYDHIHLNVPDPAVAATWYESNFGGRRITEAPDRLMYGSTRFMFLKNANGKPSAGSAIDHVGFSVADLDATMKKFEASGVKVTTPARDVPGLFKLAFVEDPWGTRIEVVQDPELLGLHHIHLRNPNPEEAFTWLLAKFGGQRTQLKGRIDAVKYSAAGFSDMWILVTKGEAEPSIGHAIDHIGWRSTGPLAGTIDGLRSKGVEVTSEPRDMKLPNGPPISFAYVAGPAAARIELVERPGLAPGK
ncbi:MAG TPA: VOC family protein [Vicinamibacterales bacterium]|nr:VOC family protein [Vicinamibacterales bacterium]